MQKFNFIGPLQTKHDHCDYSPLQMAQTVVFNL